MSVVCPRCASHEALSLSLIHREGAGTKAVSNGAAPPAKRSVTGWTLIAAACAVLFVLSFKHLDVTTVLYAGVAIVGAVMVRSNRAFNTREFPELYNRWQLSFRCNRCGAVFLVS